MRYPVEGGCLCGDMRYRIEALPPDHEVWLSHRLAWEPMGPALPGYAGGGE